MYIEHINQPNKLAASEKIRPLIKWTGGKFDEFDEFAPFIPEFKNYYEPFFGGGGVFFALQPEGLSYINDKSADLIAFYRQIRSADFKKEMMSYVEAWDEASCLSKALIKSIEHIFYEYLLGQKSLLELTDRVELFLSAKSNVKYPTLFAESTVLRPTDFKQALIDSVKDKARRIKRISEKENRDFELKELADHIETGVKSGLYLFLRKLMNENAIGTKILSDSKAAAVWYFVREFCYASMFRFNSKGEFNIPYGGIAYNKKNYRQKVDYVFATKAKKLFQHTTIFNEDFADFFKKAKPQKGDFVFLDPPYDSEFSEYDQNAFTAKDQERLRDDILKLKAKCMVVIKETPLILNLYAEKPFHILTFDKTYTYNVRGRNNRDTRHLIILNYTPPIL